MLKSARFTDARSLT